MKQPYDRKQVKRLGRYLKSLREARQWSVSGLSRKSGLSVATIRKIEAARSEPRLSSVLRLTEVLGEPIDRLINRLHASNSLVTVTSGRQRGMYPGGLQDLTSSIDQPRMHCKIVNIVPKTTFAMSGSGKKAGAFYFVLKGEIVAKFRTGRMETLRAGDALHALETHSIAAANLSTDARCLVAYNANSPEISEARNRRSNPT